MHTKGSKVLCVCAHCGAQFERFPSQVSATCSRKCGNAARTRPIAERFLEKANQDGPTQAHCPDLGPCWEWTGALFADGYGGFKVGEKMRRAHAVAYEVFVGLILPGHVVCHRCDYKRCVRPSHLFAGTSKQNTQDAIAKGRLNFGLANGMHRRGLTKLTDGQVREIYALGVQGVLQREIAARFNVTRRLISDILNGRKWRHLGLAPIPRRTGPKGTPTELVVSARALYDQGHRICEIAQMLEMSYSTVSAAVRGRSHRDVS